MPTSSPSVPRLQLTKIGSDPEAHFCNAEGLIGAPKFVGRNHALASWIGTDGCADTAEFRPRPAKDVWLHARDIAEALAVVDRVVRQKNPDVFMVAQPYDENSGRPCGGHIHASFILHDPIAVPIITGGYVADVVNNELRSVAVSANPRYAPSTSTNRAAYISAVREGRAFGLRDLSNKLRSFVTPLEYLHLAARRNLRRYGEGADAIRTDHASPKLIGPGVIRWRMEYRYPSTWLAHPALALAYLGTVKLAINNYHFPHPTAFDDVPALASYLDGFYRNNASVITEDVKFLPKILRFTAAEVRPLLQATPYVRIDFDAWAKFLNEGRWK